MGVVSVGWSSARIGTWARFEIVVERINTETWACEHKTTVSVILVGHNARYATILKFGQAAHLSNLPAWGNDKNRSTVLFRNEVDRVDQVDR